MNLSAHAWTIAPSIWSDLRPRAAPASEAWSTTLEDPAAGTVTLRGALQRAEGPGARTCVIVVQASTDLAVGEITSIEAVLFYLVTYSFSTIAAFAIVGLVRDSAGEATSLERWAGLGREAPLISAVFASTTRCNFRQVRRLRPSAGAVGPR